MKAVIFGTDQFAELLTLYLEKEDRITISAYTIDEEYMGTKKEYMGKPVVPYERVEELYSPEEYGIYICIGYSDMNRARERVFKQAKEKGYQILSYIHPTATVLSDDLGEGTIIMERAIIGAKVKAGIGNVFWPASHIAHHTEIGNFNFFTISVSVAGNIKIGNNCFFGNNCTIRDSIHVEDFTVVGAGGYLSVDSEAYGVYVPTRTVKLAGKSSLNLRGLGTKSREIAEIEKKG